MGKAYQLQKVEAYQHQRGGLPKGGGRASKTGQEREREERSEEKSRVTHGAHRKGDRWGG